MDKKEARIYTIYLSTQTPAGSLYAPVDATNKAIVTWNINWEQLYGGFGVGLEERLGHVKFQLYSLSQNAVYTWAANSGVLAIQGLGNKYSNSNNGVVLGACTPIDTPLATATAAIMYGDTLQTGGVSINLPYGYAPITVLLLDRTGALMPNMLDYQLILQFEIE
jgi:hypothetical protein